VARLPQLLLALQRVLELVQGVLQLGLHLVEVVYLVLGGLQHHVVSTCSCQLLMLMSYLEFLGRLAGGLALHVLVELVDELILVRLVVEVADLVLLGRLVLLRQATSHHNCYRESVNLV
jgi:hypothetical protein